MRITDNTAGLVYKHFDCEKVFCETIIRPVGSDRLSEYDYKKVIDSDR